MLICENNLNNKISHKYNDMKDNLPSLEYSANHRSNLCMKLFRKLIE
jgi:hypothetical protein